METEHLPGEHCSGSLPDLASTTLLAFAVTGIWHYCYYLLAPWIWSQNIPFQPADITPWIRAWTDEHDGVEIYAMYILVFATIFSTLTLSNFIRQFTGKWSRRIIATLSLTVSLSCFIPVGFTPPMNTLHVSPLWDTVFYASSIMAVVFSLTSLVYFLNRHAPRWASVVAALVLAPVCFIASAPISWDDYTYIFAPALRLLQGAALSQIYFQYDLLPSLLAAGWMKLGLDLNAFQVLGQAAYFATLLGIYIFAGKLFHNKALAVFLLATLVLARIYASPWDAVTNFQVTPLRLDLWFLLLVVVYWRGVYHWSAGLVCGLLILLLKNFGIIYSIAYIQLLLTLLVISCIDSRGKKFMQTLAEFGKRCALPVAFISCFSAVSYFLFRNVEFGNYSAYYQKIGIGFIQIASHSFYWYIPAMMSMVVILTFRLRRSLSPEYMTAGFLLTYCAIGNSIYFFGRSHEHNIINISIALLFLFFFMLDIISRYLLAGGGNKASLLLLRCHGSVVLAAVVTAVISISYANNIVSKTFTQFRNMENAQNIYPSSIDWNYLEYYLAGVREVTGNSSRVYFVDKSDFSLYYYGNYAPVGYCNPFKTWIFTSDLSSFLQRLLDNGYYLACSDELKFLLVNLQFNAVSELGPNVVVAKLTQKAPMP